MRFVIFLGFISLLVPCYYGLKWKKSDERLKWTKKYVYSLGLTIILFLVSVFGSIAIHDYEVKQSAALARSSSKRASYILSSKFVSSELASRKAARQKELDTEKLTLYPVSITSVEGKSDDLILSGTTNAPDGAKILVSYDTDDNLAEKASEYDTGYAKVKNNKFKAAVYDGYFDDDNGNKSLSKDPTVSLQIFAVQGYSQSSVTMDFTNNLKRELKKQNIARTKITLPDKVLKELHVKTASSSSSSSRSSSSTFNASEYSKNISWSQLIHNPDSYTNAQVCMSGEVTQRQVTDDGFVTLQVEVDDDPDHYIVLEYDHELEKKLSGTSTVAKGDNITVYGESVGNEERKTIIGDTLTVAAIAPEKIVIN
ncbi:hypothetical protein ACIA4L_08670 [Lactobacillus delbrueckii subsp. bulgaricus]